MHAQSRYKVVIAGNDDVVGVFGTIGDSVPVSADGNGNIGFSERAGVGHINLVSPLASTKMDNGLGNGQPPKHGRSSGRINFSYRLCKKTGAMPRVGKNLEKRLVQYRLGQQTICVIPITGVDYC